MLITRAGPHIKRCVSLTSEGSVWNLVQTTQCLCKRRCLVLVKYQYPWEKISKKFKKVLDLFYANNCLYSFIWLYIRTLIIPIVNFALRIRFYEFGTLTTWLLYQTLWQLSRNPKLLHLIIQNHLEANFNLP